MALLRRHFRQHALELGAADLEEMGSIFGSLERWSSLAARSISSALAIASLDAGGPCLGLLERYKGRLPFAILGLGRLGLSEFDLASDADLIFIASPDLSREDLVCCTRLAEGTIDMLSSYTSDGTVFAVDTRLRPRGREGELVVTSDALVQYAAEGAQVWEAMTYLKVVPVAGDAILAEGTVNRLLAATLDSFGSHSGLEAELREMRRRLEREVLVPPSNTKTAPGGYFDVDFVVSCLRLRNGVAFTPGSNTAQRVAGLRSAGLLSADDAQVLTHGAAFLRSLDHAVRLVIGKAPDGLPEHVGHAAAIEDLLRHWSLIEEGSSLPTRLRTTQEQIRAVYRRVLRPK
jgi:glutamate-ammonia-ligase adenylyltransferase